LRRTRRHNFFPRQSRRINSHTQHTPPWMSATVPVRHLSDFHNNPEFARFEEEAGIRDLPRFLMNHKGTRGGCRDRLTPAPGCHACTVLRGQSHTTSVVGKEEVAKGRHHDWRAGLDRLTSSRAAADPELYFQPVSLHALRKCPVLNWWCPWAVHRPSAPRVSTKWFHTLRRTRYCSNNCLLQVRRFILFPVIGLGLPLQLCFALRNRTSA